MCQIVRTRLQRLPRLLHFFEQLSRSLRQLPIDFAHLLLALIRLALLATQVLSRIRAKFHIQLPLRALFDAATIRDLAAHVENVQWTLQSAVSAADNSDREEFEL